MPLGGDDERGLDDDVGGGGAAADGVGDGAASSSGNAVQCSARRTRSGWPSAKAQMRAVGPEEEPDAAEAAGGLGHERAAVGELGGVGVDAGGAGDQPVEPVALQLGAGPALRGRRRGATAARRTAAVPASPPAGRPGSGTPGGGCRCSTSVMITPWVRSWDSTRVPLSSMRYSMVSAISSVAAGGPVAGVVAAEGLDDDRVAQGPVQRRAERRRPRAARWPRTRRRPQPGVGRDAEDLQQRRAGRCHRRRDAAREPDGELVRQPGRPVTDGAGRGRSRPAPAALGRRPGRSGVPPGLLPRISAIAAATASATGIGGRASFG